MKRLRPLLRPTRLASLLLTMMLLASCTQTSTKANNPAPAQPSAPSSAMLPPPPTSAAASTSAIPGLSAQPNCPEGFNFPQALADLGALNVRMGPYQQSQCFVVGAIQGIPDNTTVSVTLYNETYDKAHDRCNSDGILGLGCFPDPHLGPQGMLGTGLLGITSATTYIPVTGGWLHIEVLVNETPNDDSQKSAYLIALSKTAEALAKAYQQQSGDPAVVQGTPLTAKGSLSLSAAVPSTVTGSGPTNFDHEAICNEEANDIALRLVYQVNGLTTSSTLRDITSDSPGMISLLQQLAAAYGLVSNSPGYVPNRTSFATLDPIVISTCAQPVALTQRGLKKLTAMFSDGPGAQASLSKIGWYGSGQATTPASSGPSTDSTQATSIPPNTEPSEIRTAIATAPDAQTSRDPMIDGPISAGQPVDPSQYALNGNGNSVVTAFTTPSGNITCNMFKDYGQSDSAAICVITNHAYPAHSKLQSVTCTGGDSAQILSIGGAKAPADCVVGPLHLTKVVLNYGQSLAWQNVTCLSTKSGVRCESTDRQESPRAQGFIIAQQELTTYN